MGQDHEGSGTPNRLIDETSPYLLQHAYNPVDWYPWGREALERAAAEDRPLLVSIGYAACHWCHVMERESFEDPATAEVMNANFVCVKVDREERPDVDGVYMEAVQALTGQGGWPMTVFCSPDGTPFFAGTYFPDEPRHGMPAFRDVLAGVAEAWREQRDRIAEQGRRVIDAISRTASVRESPDPLSDDVAASAVAIMRRGFDERWGGFGGAPKFPQPMNLEFLLRRALRGDGAALEMATTTLDRMAWGGLYDQIGGGFHRYSVDAFWRVPHFEKMLSDNAQLARAYLHGWQVTGRERYERVVRETLEYLVRELRHPDGGFWSSQDADSEGVEGRFCVWSYDELARVVRPVVEHAVRNRAPGELERLDRIVEEGVRAVAAAFGASPQGNWEGANVLLGPPSPPELAADAGMSPEHLDAVRADARRALFDAREGRVRPATDDKVLAAWNGLTVSALAEAGRVLGEPRWIDAAERAADFVLTHMRRADGRLARAWRDGRTGAPGYADDHALMARACLDLYETTFDPRWFDAARTLLDDLVARFSDADRGGFFQTASDAETLVIRPKELFDNAVPSGNSAAADALLRLALFTGEPQYERAGTSALRVVRGLMERAPLGLGHALCALDLSLGPSTEVAIVADPAWADGGAMIDVIRERWRPNAVVAVARPGDRAAIDAIPLLRDRPARDGRATAYVCERFVCRRPTNDAAELRAQLQLGIAAAP